MSTQTGSISFEATGGFNSYAKQNYATLSQIKGQFATCGTGAATAAKVATIVPADSGWTLYEGATVTVKFTSKNTAATPTLNVNNTGAKEIRNYNGDKLSKEAREWLEGSAMALTYDGTYWRIQDSNLMERVHNAETGIEQNANSIVSFASMEDNYTDPNGNTVVNKAKSYVDQTAEGITTTISNVSEKVESLHLGGMGRWFAAYPREVAETNLGFLSEKKFVDTEQTQDFNIDFAMRVDFRASTSGTRYCLASSYSTAPLILLELNSSLRLRIYSMDNSSTITDKVVGTAVTVNTPCTVVVWWDSTAKEITWLLLCGDRSESGSFKPTGTFSAIPSRTVRLGCDSRVDSTWNHSSPQMDQPAIWYREQPTLSPYVCYWDITENADGEPVDVTPVVCVAGSGTVTTLSNTVNSVRQTADANSANITDLTTIASNNGLTKTTNITSRASSIEQNLSGITTRVAETESQLETVANTNLSPYFQEPLSNVYDAENNPNGYWKRIQTNAQFTTYESGLEHNGSGGWAHFVGNVTSGNPFVRFEPMPTLLKPSTEYTFLLELDGTFASTFTNVVWRLAESGETDAYDVFNTRASVEKPNSVTSGKYYMKATTKASYSDVVTLSRSYLQVYGTGTFDVYARISLYEGDYSGPYKPYVDPTLSSRVSHAETEIEQNKDAITLRATKTETYQAAQPNLAPMFSSHNADGTYPDGGVGDYWQPSNDKTYNRSFFTALEDGWMHVEAANTAQKEFVPARVDGLEANDRVTMLVEWRNATWTGNGASFYSRNYPASVQLPANWTAPVNTASGEARHTYTVSTADGTAVWNGLINWTFTAASSSTWTGDIRISFYKEVYDSSTKTYIQYAGPYKPYSGSQLYASQAELKVTADGISSTVSKISGIKYFDTTYSYSLANIKMYSTNGYSGGWNVTTSTDGTRVGDVVYLKVHDTTRNCDVYIKGTVTAVNSLVRLIITSHGYEDTLPVDTIKSTINQSADSVKIQAKHVDIEGAAIFSSGGAYDKSTTAVKTETQWYSSTSATSKSGGSWGTTQPIVTAGRYIWQRELVTYANGNTAYKPSEAGVCTQGQTDLSAYSTTNKMNEAIDASLEMHDYTIDLSGSTYDTATWYPVVIQPTKSGGMTHLTMEFNGAGGTPSWSSHTTKHWAAAVDVTYKPSQWGWMGDSQSYIDMYAFGQLPSDLYPVTFSNVLSHSDRLVMFARGGAIYSVRINTTKTPVVYTETYNFDSAQSVSPTTTQPVNTSNFVKSRRDIQTDVAATTSRANSSALKSDAVSRTQRIYYQSASTTKPSTPGTASTNWVTDETGAADEWTLKRMSYSSTKPYIYTCEQKQVVSGTVSYTPVLLDDTTTVIDGGKIITGSIAANRIDADSGTFNTANIPNLNASKINAGDITADRIKTNVVSAINATVNKINAKNINVSEINIGDLAGEVGGRNLLAGDCGKPGRWTVAAPTAASYVKTESDNGYHVNVAFDTVSGYENLNAPAVSVEIGQEYTLSCVYAVGKDYTISPGKGGYGLSVRTDSGNHGSYDTASNCLGRVLFETSVGSYRSSFTFTATVDTIYLCMNGGQVADGQSGLSFDLYDVKLERGNVATDWTPAPEDVDSAIDDASKIASNYIHADSTGINIYDNSLSNANKYYLRQTAGGTYIYRNSYLKAKYEDTITLYGGSNASGANPRTEFSSTALKFIDANGKNRFWIDGTAADIYDTDGKLGTRVDANGLTMYQKNSKRAATTANGLDIFGSDGSTSIASFGATARIGTTSTGRVEVTATGVGLYNKNNKMKVSIGTGSSVFYGGEGTYPYVELGTASTSAINIKQSATSYTSITSSGLDVYTTVSSKANKAAHFGTDILLYNSSGKYMLWANGNGISLYDQSQAERIAINSGGITIKGGTTNQERLVISSGAATFFDGGNKARLKLNGTDGVVIGNTTDANKGRMQIKDDKILFYDNSGESSLGAMIDANGLTIYQKNSKRAATTANGLDIFGSDGSTKIASFGTTATIGATNNAHFIMAADKLQAFSGTSSTPYFEVSSSTLKWGSYTAATTTAVTNAAKTASNYFTDITSGTAGVMVHPTSITTTGVRITDSIEILRSNKVMNKMDSEGNYLYDGTGKEIASFTKSGINIGKGRPKSPGVWSANDNVTIDFNGGWSRIGEKNIFGSNSVSVTYLTGINGVSIEYDSGDWTDQTGGTPTKLDSLVGDRTSRLMIGHSKTSSGGVTYSTIDDAANNTGISMEVGDNNYKVGFAMHTATYGKNSTGWFTARKPGISFYTDSRTGNDLTGQSRTGATGRIYADGFGIAPVSLYDNPSNSFSGAIPLSEDASHFTFIELYCKDNDGRYCYTKAYKPNNKDVTVTQTLSYGGDFYIKSKSYRISGTSINTTVTSGTYHTGEVNAAGSNSGSNTDVLTIIKVIGYR